MRVTELFRAILIVIFGVIVAACDAAQSTPQDADSELSALVAQMTLDEKIGQLNQIPGGRSKSLNSKLNDALLDRVRKGEIGSFLHVAGAEPLRELQRVAVEESPHGIPLLFAMDVVHGYRTIYPAPLAMAASFDPEIVEAAARMAADEATSAGLHWTFAPMIDIARDPRWGRIVEGAGSDPYLGSVMAVAQTRGFQGEGLADATTMLATIKHFGAYGAAIGGRDYDAADISQRTLNEVYLPPFYAAIEAGAGSVMTAFNDINGVPTTANVDLIRDLLKRQWGFSGLVVSDWNAIAELINHGVAASKAEAAARALEAGVDMDMSSEVFAGSLRAAVASDPNLETALEQAVLRILKLKRDLGLFDDPYKYHDAAREAQLLNPQNRAIAREAAQKAIVLLKNENATLPLDTMPQRIAVIGALADDSLSQLASWRARGDADDVITFLEALRTAYPEAEISYQPANSDDVSGPALARAKALATASDLVLLFIGEHYDLSGEARSRSSLDLPDGQMALADTVFSTGTPVVAVISGGRPLVLEPIIDHAAAIVQTWFLGVEAGPALVDILSGAVAPGGKLPLSIPRTTGQVPITYDHLNRGRPASPDLRADTARYIDLPVTPRYAFGHGLSYGNIQYSDMTISKTELAAGDTLELGVTLTNHGERSGSDTAQLYIRDTYASIARPVKQLRAFKRVDLEAGQSVRITFEITPNMLAFFDPKQGWISEPGVIELMVGAASDDIRLVKRITLTDSAMFATPAPSIEAVTRLSTPRAPTSMGRIDARAPAFDAIVAPGAEVEVLARGFTWPEGPVWIASEAALYFNDVPENRMYRWSEADGISVHMLASGGGRENGVTMREPGANGMIALQDKPGHVLLGDHGSRGVSRLNLKTQIRDVLVSEYNGKSLNSPNDLVARSDGALFFTDPPYGLRGLNEADNKELPFNGVYLLEPGADAKLLTDTMTFPNGIGLSPDETTLYVSNSDPERPVILTYDIQGDGTLGAAETLFDGAPYMQEDSGLPDGMAISRTGTIFATGPEGVYVIAPGTGEVLGVISTGMKISNCTLDADEAYLYMTSSDVVARIPLKAR